MSIPPGYHCGNYMYDKDLNSLTETCAKTSPDSSAIQLSASDPWPEPVSGELLLNDLRALLLRFVILPKWAPETIALWILHTYAFELRDVSSYLGIESPVKRCGKTTLLTVLGQLVDRPVVASNISPSAFFRVIEQLRPTLLIDEADTVLRKNDELRGILNAGYKRDTAYVVRSSPFPQAPSPWPLSTLNKQLSTVSICRFSTWCPKAIAAIGRLPDTLADRSIVIRMQRKAPAEPCERLRNLNPTQLRRCCARFVLDHRSEISAAQPTLPPSLNDRAADIWEPLFSLADLAGGDWPNLARQAAEALSAPAPESSPISSLFLDILIQFVSSNASSLFSRSIVENLNQLSDRPWSCLRNGHLTDRWLADRLREYDIRPRLIRIGQAVARGYLYDDFRQACKRYISLSDLDALKSTLPDPAAQLLPPVTCNGQNMQNPPVKCGL